MFTRLKITHKFLGMQLGLFLTLTALLSVVYFTIEEARGSGGPVPAAVLDDILTRLLAMSVIAMLLGGWVFFLISRSISKGVCQLQGNMGLIEQNNDLTIRTRMVNQDEIAATADSVNQVLDKFGTLIRQVHSSTRRLMGEVDTVAQISEKTLSHMDRQRTATERVAASMTEMSATVQQVSGNAVAAATAARQASEETAQGKQVVRQTINTIESLAHEVQQAADVIHRLQADSARIDRVVEVIREIAEQTNLLALNAAIEAARAGEQGRGFAVVADEVRNLAGKTQKSTAEIQAMIEGLQQAAREAVAVMEQGRGEALSGVEQARQAGNSLDTVARAVETISSMNSQIAVVAEQQSLAAEAMNRNVAQISSMAADTAAGAGQTARSSEKALRQVQGLRLMVEQFKVAEGGPLDLSSYKAGHLAWTTQLTQFLDGQREIPAAPLMSHQDCELGRWYLTEGRQQYGDRSDFKALEPLHAHLHEQVNEVIRRKHAGDVAGSRNALAQVGPLAAELGSQLDKLEQAAARQGRRTVS